MGNIPLPIVPDPDLKDGTNEEVRRHIVEADATASEDTPDGADRSGTSDVSTPTSEDLPYSWSDLDEAESS
jgi:hypothetical protein